MWICNNPTPCVRLAYTSHSGKRDLVALQPNAMHWVSIYFPFRETSFVLDFSCPTTQRHALGWHILPIQGNQFRARFLLPYNPTPCIGFGYTFPFRKTRLLLLILIDLKYFPFVVMAERLKAFSYVSLSQRLGL